MTVSIDISEQSGVRFLHFGTLWIQGAMRIARPWSLELEYTREMMASLLLREGGSVVAGRPPVYQPRVLSDADHWPRKILLIGLGAASLTKFLYRYCQFAHLTVVEIEPAVIAAARQFFKLPEDTKRINLVIGDGVEYVRSCKKKFDLILVDGFDENARPGALDTLPFYQMCRSCLSDNGVLAANLLGRSRGFSGSLSRICAAFEDRVLLLPSCESGNAITFAAVGHPIRIPFDELKENALALKEETGLNLLPMLARLTQAKTCLNNRLVL